MDTNTSTASSHDKLRPSDQRVAEIADVYRALGIDPSSAGPAYAQPRSSRPGLVVVPMLSNNSSFD